MSNCLLCGSLNIQDFIRIEQIPVYCNQIFPSLETAVAIQKGNLHLKHCQDCDHIYNSEFDESLMSYDASYDASLDFSPSFRSYISRLADYLIDRHNLHNKIVIEIACGKGGFLKTLSTKARNQYLGFDPSFDGESDVSENVTIYPQYYDESALEKIRNLDGGHVDFAICRHALEHVGKPLDMIKGLNALLKKNSDAKLYFEVPNSLFMVRDLSIWDFIYEHVSYFSPKSLHYVFSEAGFSVESCYENFQRQFLSLEASIADANTPEPVLDEASGFVESSRDHLSKIIDSWEQFLEKDENGVVLWGAGSKGVTFLNLVKNSEKIRGIVDINPNKIGNFAPGTGHRIIAKNELLKLKPETVIVMNPVYRDEIQGELKSMGLSTNVIVVSEFAMS